MWVDAASPSCCSFHPTQEVAPKWQPGPQKLHFHQTLQFSLVRFSSAKHSTVWFTSLRFSSVQFGSVCFSSVQLSRAHFSWVQFGLVQLSSVCFGTVWFGSLRHSSAQHYLCFYNQGGEVTKTALFFGNPDPAPKGWSYTHCSLLIGGKNHHFHATGEQRINTISGMIKYLLKIEEGRIRTVFVFWEKCHVLLLNEFMGRLRCVVLLWCHYPYVADAAVTIQHKPRLPSKGAVAVWNCTVWWKRSKDTLGSGRNAKRSG